MTLGRGLVCGQAIEAVECGVGAADAALIIREAAKRHAFG